MSDVPLDPINRQAAKVFDKGEQVQLKLPKDFTHSRDPLPVVTDVKIIQAMQISGTNITGFRRGLLTVIGLSATVPKRWVVRCDCGNYEHRKASSIQGEYKPAHTVRCAECQLAYRKKPSKIRDQNTELILP